MKDYDELLTDDDLARESKRAKSSWQKDRVAGRGPRFIRVGRFIRYRRSDWEAWLDAQTCSSTSDLGPEGDAR